MSDEPATPPADPFAAIVAATTEVYGPPPPSGPHTPAVAAPVRSRKPRPPMADRIEAEKVADKTCHDWIVAANVRVDTKTAKHAAFRLSFRADEGLRIDALEVLCTACRRPIDDVADEPCAAKIDNTHLIGGTPGERAKRNVPKPVGRVVQSGPITRKGMAGYSTNRFR